MFQQYGFIGFIFISIGVPYKGEHRNDYLDKNFR